MLILLLSLTGCSLHWYDEQSGTQHLLGFGYLKMRAIPQPIAENTTDQQSSIAFVTGHRNLGVQLGGGSDFSGISAGWDSRSRVIIKGSDASFSLLWPTNSIWLPTDIKNLFDVYVGTNFPVYPYTK